jgi:hypothetical protein
MIFLKTIVENITSPSQEQQYDLNTDFTSFIRELNSNNEAVKQKFENIIGSKLVGKRISAMSAKGYKQFEQNYELYVSKITIENYYDNFVIIAHDNTNQKKIKKYFLNTSFPIKIKKSNTVGGNPTVSSNNPPTSNKTNIKENDDVYTSYSIEDRIDDIKLWIVPFLKNKAQDLRAYVNLHGWTKTINNKTISMYDITLPISDVSYDLSENNIIKILNNVNNHLKNTKYKLIKYGKSKEEYKFRIKKISIKNNVTDSNIKHFNMDNSGKL